MTHWGQPWEGEGDRAYLQQGKDKAVYPCLCWMTITPGKCEDLLLLRQLHRDADAPAPGAEWQPGWGERQAVNRSRKAYDTCQGQSGWQLCCARSSQAGWRTIKQDPISSCSQPLLGLGKGRAEADLCSRAQADCLWETQCLSLPAAGMHPVLPFLTQTIELQSNPVLFEMLKDSLEMFFLYKGQDMPLAQSISASKASGKLNVQLHAAQPGRCAAEAPLLHTVSSGKAGNVSLSVDWWRSTHPKCAFICLPKRWEVYPRQSSQCKANLLAVPALQKNMELCGLFLHIQTSLSLG